MAVEGPAALLPRDEDLEKVILSESMLDRPPKGDVLPWPRAACPTPPLPELLAADVEDSSDLDLGSKSLLLGLYHGRFFSASGCSGLGLDEEATLSASVLALAMGRYLR